MLSCSYGSETLFFVIGVRSADINNIDFWVDVDVAITCVDLRFDSIWGARWEDGGDEAGSFHV